MNSDLEQGLAKYDALDFRGALADLQRAVKAPGLSPRDLIETLATMGRIHAVLNNPKWAELRFEKVLRLDPTYELSPEESPRIREIFVAAQQALAARRTSGDNAGALELTLEPVPPSGSTATEPGMSPAGWALLGGAAGVVVVGLVTAILVGASRRDVEPATVIWQLP